MPPDLPISVSYEFTKDDFVAFNRYHTRSSPTARRQYLRALFVFPGVWLVLWLGLVYFAGQKDGNYLQAASALKPLIIFLPLYCILFPIFHRRTLRRAIDSMIDEGSNRRLFGVKTVTASESGITESGDHGTSTTAWSAVERIVRLEDVTYVYVTSLSAEVIPRRAFESGSEYDAFIRRLQDYHAQGSNNRVVGSD